MYGRRPRILDDVRLKGTKDHCDEFNGNVIQISKATHHEVR